LFNAPVSFNRAYFQLISAIVTNPDKKKVKLTSPFKEKTEHEAPEEILERVAEKQERILELVEEMRALLLEERL
jgi:hypothetical protein